MSDKEEPKTMSDKEESSASKRTHEPDNQSDDDDGSSCGWIGPLPTDAAPSKKRKGKCLNLPFSQLKYKFNI